MPTVNSRVQKHRDALRQAGLRPVQIWVPDTRKADIVEQIRRECRLAAISDSEDENLQAFMDNALNELGDWEG